MLHSMVSVLPTPFHHFIRLYRPDPDAHQSPILHTVLLYLPMPLGLVYHNNVTPQFPVFQRKK